MRSRPNYYYPIFLNIKDKKCVVIGGGNVAYRKIKALIECGAKVTVISPDFSKDLLKISRKNSIQLIKRSYRKGDIKDATIVIAATANKEVNRKISEDSKNAGAIVNVVDDIERSNYIVPSFFRRGNLTIAVSTGGKSPYIARKIKEMLENSFGKEYGLLIDLVGEMRTRMLESDLRINRRQWESLVDIESLLNLLRKGRLKEAKRLLTDTLKMHRY